MTEKNEAQGFTYHVKAAGGATIRQWMSLLPPAFWNEGREVCRHSLLAARSLINNGINTLETMDEKAAARQSRKKAAQTE